MLLNLLRKRKEDAEILLTLGTPVPNCFGLIYFLLFSVWTVNRAPKKLEGFFSARKKKGKEKPRPSWEGICYECILPALSDVWPYTPQKGILDVDSLSTTPPWSKTYSQHLQLSWSYWWQWPTEKRVTQLLVRQRMQVSLIFKNNPVKIQSLQNYAQGNCFSKIKY